MTTPPCRGSLQAPQPPRRRSPVRRRGRPPPPPVRLFVSSGETMRSASGSGGGTSGAHAGADRAGDTCAAEPAVAVRVLRQVLLVVALGVVEAPFCEGGDLGGHRRVPSGCEQLPVGLA